MNKIMPDALCTCEVGIILSVHATSLSRKSTDGRPFRQSKARLIPEPNAAVRPLAREGRKDEIDALVAGARALHDRPRTYNAG